VATPSDVLGTAQQWVNKQVPYLYGGISQAGADCSGFVQSVFASVGLSLPRTSQQQAQTGLGISIAGPNGLANAQPGDLLFFDNSGHVGIYAGNGEMYDEAHTGSVAQLEPVWTSQLNAIRREPLTDAGNTTVASGASFSSNFQNGLSIIENGQTGQVLTQDVLGSFLNGLVPSKASLVKVALIIGGALIVLVGLLGIMEPPSATPIAPVAASGRRIKNGVQTGATVAALS